jgi:hypothetical protein
MKVLAAANCITIEEFLQHNRRQSKKTAQSWRVLRRLFAYAHEPAHTTNPPESQNRPNLRETTAMKTVITSNSSLLTIPRSRSTLILIAFTLMAFVLAQRTQAVNPPPDGGYPGGNTAEGQGALLNLTSGTFNTAVGLFSLRSNTQNMFNTAIGAGALFASTGNDNTATGAGALLTNTTGTDNTANGSFALLNNTTGTENAAFGASALLNSTTGGGNTAVGFNAGFGITTADNVIVIGTNVGG